MEILKERIRKEGTSVGSDRINVDGFINHKIDSKLMDQIGLEFKNRFSGVKVDKILTVEASGIAIASFTSVHFDYAPIVFAKKTQPNTMVDDCYTANAMSFTKQQLNMLRVVKRHLTKGENILIIDDFLAHGEASLALCEIVEKAGCNVVGIGIVISKDFQGGRKKLEDKGYRVEVLAPVKSLNNGVIEFY